MAGKDPFEGFEKAVPSVGGVWVEPGVYPRVAIVNVKYIDGGFKGNSYVAELDILESSVATRAAGTRMSWVCNLKHASAMGNIKGFIASCLNSDHKAITREHMRASINDNILRGTVVKIIATPVGTRAGGTYTKCTFEYVSGGPVEEFARAAAEAAKAG